MWDLLVQLDIYFDLLTESLAGKLSIASSTNILRTKPCDFPNASSLSRMLSVNYVIFEKMFVSRERNYPEVIYYNISKIASELLYE